MLIFRHGMCIKEPFNVYENKLGKQEKCFFFVPCFCVVCACRRPVYMLKALKIVSLFLCVIWTNPRKYFSFYEFFVYTSKQHEKSTFVVASICLNVPKELRYFIYNGLFCTLASNLKVIVKFLVIKHVIFLGSTLRQINWQF